MDDQEIDLKIFRVSARVMLMEQLILRNALLDPTLRGVPLRDSQRALKGWLDTNVAIIDRAYGAALGDPALTALYADEVREAAESMKGKIDKMAEEAENNPL